MSRPLKILIIGFGSIAKKHVNALRELAEDAIIDALRSSKEAGKEEDVNNIFELNPDLDYDFVMICNPTSLHSKSIKDAMKLGCPIFLEKPPFASLIGTEEIIKELASRKIISYTAYNLRFLESLIFTKNYLKDKRLEEVNIYCGSHLPDWRPNTNYKDSYSAKADLGGGVDLDLIHELDYTVYIFGHPSHVSSFKKSASSIEIDAYDYAHYVLDYGYYHLHITLNYYRKEAKREIEIVTNQATIKVDLLKNEVLDITNNVLLFSSTQRVVDTYKLQMRYFLDCLENKTNTFNKIEDSITVLKYALT